CDRVAATRDPSGEKAAPILRPGRAESVRGLPPADETTNRSGLPFMKEVKAISLPDGDHEGRMFCDRLVSACTFSPSQCITKRSGRRAPVSPAKVIFDRKKLSSPV